VDRVAEAVVADLVVVDLVAVDLVAAVSAHPSWKR